MTLRKPSTGFIVESDHTTLDKHAQRAERALLKGSLWARRMLDDNTPDDYVKDYQAIELGQRLNEFSPRVLKDNQGFGRSIVLDTETTGLDSVRDEIISLGIVDANSGDVVYDSLLWPSKSKRWPDAERVNHISYDMVRDAPSIMQERERIQSILDNARVFVGYNVYFDVSMLESAGFDLSTIRVFMDVMLDYAAYYGEWDGYHAEPKWQKLSFAANECGYDYRDAHTAIGDCRATLAVGNYMASNPKQEVSE